jgi:hypothetical protein
MTKIFISYRRADSEGYVGRLYDHLIQCFDKNEIFLDVGKIKPGQDFLTVIEQVVGSCDALLAVIGPGWLDVENENGIRRIDQSNDVLRLEIATALKRGILVIPVLIEKATMPNASRLPDDLSDLARRNAIEISHDRFAYDVERLVEAIGGAYGQVTVALGASYLPFRQARILSPLETFEIWINRKKLAKLEGPGIHLGNQEAKKKDWQPARIRLEAGVHTISVKSLRSDFALGISSNTLTFKLKGGQSVFFQIERQTSSIGQTKIMIQPYKPIVDV